MAEMIGGLLTSKIHECKQLHPCYLHALSLASSHEAELQQSPPTSRSARDLLPYQHEQTAVRQRKARRDRRGEMKDGNGDEMEVCDGQGHVSMEIL